MTDNKTQFGRLERLEARHEAAKSAAPALIVRESRETEAQARERYTAEHGYPPPAGTPVIHIVRAAPETVSNHQE